MEDVDKHILLRGIGLSALGKLDAKTVTYHIMKEQEGLKIL